MQIPVLSGIASDSNAEFRTSYPVNLIPVPKQSGISQGYLRPADGIVHHGTGPGIDRGGINWNGICYRVMGSKFVSVAENGTVTTIGSVAGGSDRAKFDYSPDRLAIVCGGSAYYYNGTLTQITDSDLGAVHDVIFVDGYFMFPNSQFLIVTELADPTSIDPLKYGSAETDPDEIQGLLKVRNEPWAIGRYTCEVFQNIGGDSEFPFARIEGAMISRGSIGRNSHCKFGPTSIAFLGSGRGESPSVYLAENSISQRIATREIDTILQGYTEAQLTQSILEQRFDKGHQHLYVHLPDRTLVYDAAGSAAAQEPVWFVLVSTLGGFSQYRARNLVWCYDRWLCGDPLELRVGYLSNELSSHYGDHVRWEFATIIIYNDGASGIMHEIELVALTGRVAFGLDPYIRTSYSKDGLTWSQNRAIKVGARGERDKRLVWRQQGTIGHFRSQRFQGDSQSFASFARLEVQVEPLAYATS
jgi:hypothetical protein